MFRDVEEEEGELAEGEEVHGLVGAGLHGAQDRGLRVPEQHPQDRVEPPRRSRQWRGAGVVDGDLSHEQTASLTAKQSPQ